MSLLTPKPKQQVRPEPDDFRLPMDGDEVALCLAGLNGQRLCKHYRRGKWVLPGYNYCMWYNDDDHGCLRAR